MFKKNEGNTFFKKKKKYRIIESFANKHLQGENVFKKGEQLIYKDYGFIPYDDLYSYWFINSQKENKYLVVNKNELPTYYKYFIEEKENIINLWTKIKKLLK